MASRLGQTALICTACKLLFKSRISEALDTMPRVRIDTWLPRGGLGYLGIVTAVATLVVPCVFEPSIAFTVCLTGSGQNV